MAKPKPGTGKKFCKNCGTTCGASTKICTSCETPFVGKAKLKAESEAKTRGKVAVFPAQYDGYRIFRTIYVPAGVCPVQLKKCPTQEDIEDWADELRLIFIEQSNDWLLNHALCYYLRYDYPYNDKKYEAIAQKIAKLEDVRFIEKST